MAPQRLQRRVATLESEDRPDEALAVATQREAVLAAALGEDCEVGVEGEGPNERHAGPCAVRYNRDTQCDMSATLHSRQILDVIYTEDRNKTATIGQTPKYLELRDFRGEHCCYSNC